MQTTKKKVSILTILLIVISLLAISSSGYFWYQSQLVNSATAQAEAPPAPPVFLTLKPFTVSLPTIKNGHEVNKVLYIGMVLRVADEAQKMVMLEYLPEVRSDLLLLLANQDVDKLKGESGKLALRELVKGSLSRQYNKKMLVNVDEVLFTDFIIR